MSKSPMLSAKFNDESHPEAELQPLIDRSGGYVLGSFKLDGIRAIWWEGKLVSRSLKPIPNFFTQERFSSEAYRGFDGELIWSAPNAKGVFENTQSAVMSRDGTPNLTWYLFDNHLWNEPFHKRVDRLLRLYAHSQLPPHTHFLNQKVLRTPEEILEYEEEALAGGYEGLILKSPLGEYKYGRSTLKQAGMIKMKRMITSEAKVTGFVELYRNQNEAFQSETGHQRRSSSKEGKVPAGIMGTLEVTDIHNGMEFEIGSGFDVAMRTLIWNNRPAYLGKIVEYKYLPYGTRDKPRHPIFLRFRDQQTMSPPMSGLLADIVKKPE